MSQASTSRRQNLLKWLLPLLFILLAVAIFAYMRATKPQAPSKPAQEKLWAVSVMEAQPAAYQPELTLYGKVETPRMSTLSASVTADVLAVNTDEGDAFEHEALLIQLDERDSRLLLAQRSADLAAIDAQIDAEKVRHSANLKALTLEKNLLALTQKSVERYENLAKRSVASQNQLDEARRSYQQQALALNARQEAINDHPNRLRQLEANRQRAQALLDAAQLDLERCQIRPRYTGRVARLHVAPGDRVRSGDPLITLYGLERLEVRAQIPAKALPALRAAIASGEPLHASALLDQQPLELTLQRLAAEVDGARAGVDAFFSLSSDSRLPEPGRALALNLKLPEQPQLLALPPQALYGLDRIYRITDGRLDAVSVERIGDVTLPEGEARVLVRSDSILAGDRIVTTQLPNAIAGLKVKEASQ